MTLLKITPGLSRLDEVDRLAAKTHKGMAHFAGTSTDPDARCSSCALFDPCRAKAKGIFTKPPEGHCRKFTELMRFRGPAFPATARACRHHQVRP